MSTVAEKQHYRQSLETDEDDNPSTSKRSAKTKKTPDPNIENLKEKFSELFN